MSPEGESRGSRARHAARWGSNRLAASTNHAKAIARWAFRSAGRDAAHDAMPRDRQDVARSSRTEDGLTAHASATCSSIEVAVSGRRAGIARPEGWPIASTEATTPARFRPRDGTRTLGSVPGVIGRPGRPI